MAQADSVERAAQMDPAIDSRGTDRFGASSRFEKDRPSPGAPDPTAVCILVMVDGLEAAPDIPGCRYVRACDREEAQRALEAENFAAAVLEFRVPEETGPELTGQAVDLSGVCALELTRLIRERARTRHLPVLLLSSSRDPAHIRAGYEAGGSDWLSRPFPPEVLRFKLTLLLDLDRRIRALEAETERCYSAEQHARGLNRRLSQRLEQITDSNAELESFGDAVSHELRAPLRQVAGFVSLLKKSAGPGLCPEGAEYLGLIQDSVTRMARLIDSLLAFSRVGRLEMRTGEVSLRDMVEQARRSLLPTTAGRNVHWTIGPLPAVQADPALILQVLTNLLDNALKFTRKSDPAEIEIGCRSAGPDWVIFVRDNGAGFDPRYAGRLFGLFQRLHSAADYEGTGVGLANVRRIIQRHEGRTWAESSPGKGTTVLFSLPRSRGSKDCGGERRPKGQEVDHADSDHPPRDGGHGESGRAAHSPPGG